MKSKFLWFLKLLNGIKIYSKPYKMHLEMFLHALASKIVNISCECNSSNYNTLNYKNFGLFQEAREGGSSKNGKLCF